MSDNTPAQSRAPANFPVVGLCASAGGLNAYNDFLDHLPVKTGMAYIIVQHLAPDRESILDQIIRRRTEVPTHRIEDGMAIEPDNVYVLPAGHELRLERGHLYLYPFKRDGGWPALINKFLISLGEELGARAAAAILSGVGTDGLDGARLLKDIGAVVIAQSLATAEQTDMPRSIIEERLATMILSPDRMPQALIDHFKSSTGPPPPDVADDALGNELSDDDLDRTVRRLRRLTGYDFSDYKDSTLRRQLARRMSLRQVGSIDAYLDYLEAQPEEAEQLVRYLLINVTHFFRDPDAFEALKEHALRPLLGQFDIDTVFRGWVPGCATGEEAISIAILIYECLRDVGKPQMEVRLFATDVNHDLVRQARSGWYPKSIAQDITPERLEAHFVEENGGYRVRSHIARMVIWSPHNLAEHPPFSNMHLISCRNVMIYFKRALQERIVALFHFALRPDGLLFLGSSETMSHQPEAFEVVDNRHKIYRRVGARRPIWSHLVPLSTLKISDHPESTMPENNPPAQPQPDREEQIINNLLVEHYNTTCVLVDEHYLLRYSTGEIDRYLRLVPGRDRQRSILDMAREGLDTELTIALHESFSQEREVVRRGVWVKTNGDERIVDLVVKPVSALDGGGPLRLIILELTTAGQDLQEPIDESGEDGATIQRLRTELEETQRALQTVTQALQAKSEELTSSMEEIRSANEEVQTTNEELRTSKEELESMNEELNTLNTQLTDQNTELTHANDTLHNFLHATEIGMIFLDQDLLIREFTQAATEVFGLRRTDVGRPLAEIANQIGYSNLADDAEYVLDTLHNVDTEVHSSAGRWYNLRIRPYRTTTNIIDGVVLIFTDITKQKEAQEQAELQTDYVRKVTDTVSDSLVELDAELRIVHVNASFYAKFQVNESETVGRLLYDVGNGQWDIPDLRRLLNEIIPQSEEVRDYIVTHDFPSLGTRTMRLNARRIDALERILLVITEVTDDEAGA